MSFKNVITAVMTEIKQKLTNFCKDLDESAALTPELYLSISTGLKDSLAAGGIAGLRTFLECKDLRDDKLEINGVTFYHKTSSCKEFLSPFGVMVLSRNVFQSNKGGKCIIPLDRNWGMVDEFATPDVRDAILFGSSDLSPCTAEKFFKKASLFHPSHTAIENIINETGELLDSYGTSVLEQVRSEEELPKETQVVVESLDGANLRLREIGIKKGRPVENPGKDDSRSTASCFKNAMVGSILCYGKPDDDTRERARLKSIYVARMPEEKALRFKSDLEAESSYWRKQINSSIIRMTVTDGALGIWKYLDTDPHYSGILKLLDFYHATEHLGAAAEALFGKNNHEGKAWYSKWKGKLKEENGAPLKLCRSIEYFLTYRRLGKTRKAEAQKQLTFFRRNKKRMNYIDFINKGLPIGSGPVEAACKTIVKHRMCKSGMRWSREGGQPILSIRAIVKSQRWDQFWRHTVLKQHELMQAAA